MAALALTAIVFGLMAFNSNPEPQEGATFTKGLRYYNEPVDMLRDYQIKVSEDEQYFIIYDGLRKVGVIPYKNVTWKMKQAKDDISWLIDGDMYKEPAY